MRELEETFRKEKERLILWLALANGLIAGITATCIVLVSGMTPLTWTAVGVLCIGIIAGLLLVWAFHWLVFRILGFLRRQHEYRRVN